MKRFALLALAAAAAITAQAQPYGRPGYAVAAPAQPVAVESPTFVDRARVESVQPQYEVVQAPRQECTSQLVQDAPQPVASNNGVAGAVIGGVAGGILGHQVGRGNGNTAATAAGAIVGAIAGNSIQNSNQQQQYVQAPPREVQNCRTVMDQQQHLVGYRVTYEYRGNQYTTVMHEQPGNSLPVRVSVTPLEEREYHRR
ncbi:glycine zipper 2TM domain-containing protein [Ramlibacter ginsenosidimutans]|uniref:Glycine zipper 2TM domain-containing protein n=1 Tax=Ramlibacter ginsenosidimutans TaxID=502333 RepID=A0A934TPV6_9BURK|nr:glycine zipper 2TM domain-containing protein [Ramlibacter ginsenosidimutans]MBK6005288.1 glycine zipper 2TM domain-containing protein [Ramlibacter ginsenosidimutans]